MKFNGICKEVNKLVVSDPSYAEGIWCRYERNDINGKNWKVIGFINDSKEEYEGIAINGKEFTVALCAPDALGFVQLHDDGSFAYAAKNNIKEYTIGMDTACVALGINGQADEIKASHGEWQPDCSLRTLTDGEFGSVQEGTYNGQVKFIVISGYLDEDTGYTTEDILNYLSSAFGTELVPEHNLEELLSDAQERSSDVAMDNEKEDIDLNK